jgi:chorismate dehydratase
VRIGLVSYLNARPLGYGLLGEGRHEIVLDLPSRLVTELKAGRLDAALISSVECLRSPDLGFSDAVGVCADGLVRSILYFERKESNRGPGSHLPLRVLADSGSRTSQALLRVLFQKELGAQPVLEQTPAAKIPALLKAREGGLLIGDAALDFYERPDADDFVLRDLGQWWKDQEGLPMVYALWAFPASRPVPDSVFVESLEAGLARIDSIAEESGRRGAADYLKSILHYRLTDADKKALNVFSERLGAAGLL